jgi:anti-anti-sigma factor
VSLLARVTEEQHDDLPVAVVEGEIDASNSREIGERLRRLLTNRSTALVIDLTETTYMDSAGIHLLFGLAAELTDRQQRLALVVPPDSQLVRVVTITGLDQAVDVHATRADALARAA